MLRVCILAVMEGRVVILRLVLMDAVEFESWEFGLPGLELHEDDEDDSQPSNEKLRKATTLISSKASPYPKNPALCFGEAIGERSVGCMDPPGVPALGAERIKD